MSADKLHWFSIEVFDGAYPVSQWNETFGKALLEQAFLDGAQDWDLKRHVHGVVLELGFENRAAWERFAESFVTKRAFESAPDPQGGVIIHEGRGGPGWKPSPRKPRPFSGAGAASLPLPLATEVFDVPTSAVEQRLLRNVMSNN